MIYSVPDGEKKVHSHLKSLEGQKVALYEITENISKLGYGPVKVFPYERGQLTVFWSNSSFYHGAYIKCTPCEGADGTFSVNTVIMYTEFDRHF